MTKFSMSINELANFNVRVEKNFDKAITMYFEAFEITKAMYCRKNKTVDVLLEEVELRKIEDIAFLALSHMNIFDRVTEDLIIDILKSEAGAKLDRCVSEVLSGFMKKEKKPVSSKKRKELRSRSFAICNAQLNKSASVIKHKESKFPKEDRGVVWNADEEILKAEIKDLKVMATMIIGNNKNKDSYRLSHHRADMKHTLVPQGVVDAMGELLGHNNEVRVSNWDKHRAYKHLANHYREMGLNPPPFRD